MDTEFLLNGIAFVANRDKAATNEKKHGISLEQAAEAFFDPFLKVVDASREDEARDAIIGMDAKSRLLFVVHLIQENDYIRLISARKATKQERDSYEND
ncbi:MAG: BrnT family toxin [Pseudomonadales bacterium]